MTLFEILVICIVAAMFVATIFMFTIYIKNIKKVNVLESKVTAMSNVAFECRSFLEKLSKHDVIVKINNISGLEKKIEELLGICKNQTNNINSVKESLDNTMDDIKKRNNSIKDIHKLSDSINVKINKIQDSINNIEELTNNITYIKEKLGEVSVDSEKYVTNFDKKLEDILSWVRRCRGGIESLIDGHNKAINALEQSFEVVNTKNDVTSNAIDKTYNDVKSILKDIAKIGSVLDSYREKVNYIATWVENATKPKMATKTKTTKTPIDKKGVQKYL